MQKISVIVPVYNTEKYLKKCLDSILMQTYPNIEVIVVNDGSPDDAETIINEYKKKYENKLIYLKKGNGGLSDSRNYGVKFATGDYICFVDSDDYIDKNLFSDLQKYMHLEYDMIKFKLIKVDKNYNEIEKIGGPVFEEKNGSEAFNILYAADVMLQPAWLYLYKRTFWNKNKFEYPKEKFHEDFARTALILLKAKRVVSVDVYGYYYYQSETSITRGNNESKKNKRAWDMLEHYDYMVETVKKYKLDKLTEENLKIYYTNNILLKIEDLSKDSRKQYITEIKKRKMIKNINARNLKQLAKKIVLHINIDLYLKLRS